MTTATATATANTITTATYPGIYHFKVIMYDLELGKRGSARNFCSCFNSLGEACAYCDLFGWVYVDPDTNKSYRLGVVQF